MACPNCGAVDTRPTNASTVQLWCSACGSYWCLGNEQNIRVPQCSRPPEYKPAPDCEGEWRYWLPSERCWKTIVVTRSTGVWEDLSKWWVKVPQPPPPPQPKSPAERLRAVANAMHAYRGIPHEQQRELLAIANELEGRK